MAQNSLNNDFRIAMKKYLNFIFSNYLSPTPKEKQKETFQTVIQLGLFARPENVKGHVFHISIHNYIISKATDSSNSKTFKVDTFI